MKEKLIELLNAMIGENKDKNITTEVMADYLIQNGVVVLPCKVWDKGCSCGHSPPLPAHKAPLPSAHPL